MSLSQFRVMVTVILCTALMLSCSKDSTGPDEPLLEAKTFAGKIISINEDEVSWDGLRFGLITSSTLVLLGDTQHFAGEAFCVTDIGADSTFSFNLPIQIESRWIFMGYSCFFSPKAYNDTNGNGVFDFEYEPSSKLYENGQTSRLFIYVSNPQQLLDMGFSVSVGWNVSESPYVYSTDFDHEFMMGVYSP